jgi:hypothetical protein
MDCAAFPSFWDFFFESKPERVRKLVITVRMWRQQQARAANTFLMGSIARPTATETEPEIDVDVINVDVSVDSTYDWSLVATLPTGGLPVNRLRSVPKRVAAGSPWILRPAQSGRAQ